MKTAAEHLKQKGIHPHEQIFWYSGTEYLTLSQVMEDYANQKLDSAAELAFEVMNYGSVSASEIEQKILKLKSEINENS